MLKCQVVFFSPCKLVESQEVTLLWAVPREQESKAEVLWDSSLGPGGEVLPCPAPLKSLGSHMPGGGPPWGEKQEWGERTRQCFLGPCRELWH